MQVKYTFDNRQCAALLIHIADWCCEHQVGSGIFQSSPEPDCDDSIFINGNFARLLLCAYELTGHNGYKTEAINWCDDFVYRAAMPVTTSRGDSALWWWDCKQTNLYLADTGTACYALIKALPHVDQRKRRDYLDALDKFYHLVVDGTNTDPMDRGQEPSPGWIITDGPDAGSFGVGYRKGRLETRAYTVSTATAGAQLFSALYRETGRQDYRSTALAAANWLANQVDDGGYLSYRIEGGVVSEFLFQQQHYATEGFLTAWSCLRDEEYNSLFVKTAPRIVEYILSCQLPEGYWGTLREYDGQRSIFLPRFLHWYCNNAESSPRAKTALERFVEYVLDPGNTLRFGVNNLVRVSGFVGLLMANLVHENLDLTPISDSVTVAPYSVEELRNLARRWAE